MGCGCGKRAIRLLKAMGYVEEAGYLRKGDRMIPVAEAELHHTRITAKAAAEEFVLRLRGAIAR